MNYIKKGLSLVLIISIIVLFPFPRLKAEATVFYKTSEIQTITSGATLEKITRYTTEGWQNIRVLRVDLTNPYVKIDSMVNTEKTMSSAKTIAQSKGAVAAINGGFFFWIKDEPGKGYADGPIVENGDFVTALSNYNKEADLFATFSIDNLNKAMVDYWKIDISFTSPNGNVLYAGRYNKPCWDYKDFTILDARWSKMSLGASTKFPDIVEMVVDEGKVREIREAMPPVEIPVNGYVIVTRKDGGELLKDNYQAGDDVILDITSTPDWNNLSMAVTGGSILIKNGYIPDKFSHNSPDVSGKHPRTAIGSTSDGKEIIMVTVDGRQQGSAGMTQTQLAWFMVELGAHNAINLDGGGSTTMAARTLGTDDLEIMNNPSDGSPRRIPSAVGVFSLAPPSELDGMVIDTVDARMFAYTSRSFTVRGYDKYFNPVEIKPEDIKWSASGVPGTFDGNTFTALSPGNGTIKAEVNGISAELKVNVYDSPVQLELGSRFLKLSQGRTKSFTVYGKTSDGFRVNIAPGDVAWNLSGNIGSIVKGTFTASGNGEGYIDASLGSVHAYCAISGANEPLDSFEKSNGTYLAYPADIIGSYELSDEQKHSGSYAGKLTYDFPNSDSNRAAYMVLPNSGMALSKNTADIGLWVYNPEANSNWLAATVTDANGKQHSTYFTKTMDWTGWKYVEAPLDGITAPVKLNRLYLVQVNPLPVTGHIYYDDLSAITTDFSIEDLKKLPQDTVPVDTDNISVTYEKTDNSLRFAVFGQTREPKNLLEKILLRLYTDKIGNSMDVAAFVGQGTHIAGKSVKIPVISTYTGYKAVDIINSRFIQLDMSKGGLRASSLDQWQWFLNQLDTAAGGNVFIFLSGNPASFTDTLEGGLFKQVVENYKQKTGKTVWVFYKDTKNASYMEKGIKYLTTPGYEIDGLTPTNAEVAKYIQVTVQGSKVTFEYISAE